MISAVTLFYTFFGGIRAVVWMDVVQMCVYVGGALLAAGIILSRISGGLSGFIAEAFSLGKLKLIDFGFNLGFKDFIAQPYIFLTAVLGGGVFSLASHGTDHLIVQRLLATKNLRSSQKALIGSGIAVFLQFALFLCIGVLLYIFYHGASPQGLGLATADEIFAKFIVEEIPAGVSGLIIAAILAAAMSTLSSSLNSLASATTMDLYKPYWGKSNTPDQDIRVSRIITLVWGVILTGSAFLFVVLQLKAGEGRPAVVELGLGIASYTYGGLLGAFTLGMLSRKIKRTDAAIGFYAGLIALLFIVKGPVQNILPGEGLNLAWPWYTAVGAAIVFQNQLNKQNCIIY
jgi:Na+/proline symporter